MLLLYIFEIQGHHPSVSLLESQASECDIFVLKEQRQKNTDEDLINFFKKYGIEFNNIDDSINKFIAKRENLRKKKEYKAADEMRESILELGISIEDGKENGWSWKNN